MPLTLIYYQFLISIKAKRIVFWLLIISIAFYSYWRWENLFILIPSLLLNFLCGEFLAESKNNHLKKWVLIFTIATNLTLLIYFKYFSFFFGEIVSFFNINASFYVPTLPLGISFFTFTQIAYLIDIYYRKTKPSSFDSYALFVTYFPHVIAGPLLHHKPMIKQFEKPFYMNKLSENIALGSAIFIIGLFKKVVIADHFSVEADAIFNLTGAQLESVKTIQAWYGAFCYTLQLYFDFSGYSDMAIGISRFFGIALPINFNSPYKAYSISDFWRRWHITLSSFLRDYLYIPLGGSHEGFVKKLINLMIVMTLCGIWHGANYTFALWGVYHGVLLCIHNLWKGIPPYLKFPQFKYSMLRNQLAFGTTFLAIVIGWVIFRAPNLSSAEIILSSMFSLKMDSQTIFLSLKNEILFFSSLFIVFFCPNSQEICKIDNSGNRIKSTDCWWQWRPTPFWALILGLMLLISLYQMNKISPFLYFQF